MNRKSDQVRQDRFRRKSYPKAATNSTTVTDDVPVLSEDSNGAVVTTSAANSACLNHSQRELHSWKTGKVAAANYAQTTTRSCSRGCIRIGAASGEKSLAKCQGQIKAVANAAAGLVRFSKRSKWAGQVGPDVKLRQFETNS